MPDNSTKEIQNIQIGDMVQAFDAEGNTHSAKVIQTKKHEQSSLVSLNGVTTTLEHRFLTKANTFKQVRELTAEDTLVTAAGECVPWTLQPLDEKADVYNIEVETYHTYIAGGFRVHNWK